MKKTSRLAILLASFALPLFAFAAGINDTALRGYVNSIKSIINDILVPLLIAVAFIVFLWGVFKYFIYGADNEAERTTGKTFILYGVIGLVIIFSIWGIVQIFMGTLNIGATNAPPSPTIGGSGGAANGSPGANSSFPGAGTVTPGGGTTGGVYPTTPVNGACPAGSHLSSGYCVNDTSTTSGDNADVQRCIQNNGDPAVCRCALDGRGGEWNQDTGRCEY